MIIIGIITAFSLDTNSEFFSTVLWFVPSSMMILAIAFGDKNSLLIDMNYSNRFIKFIGNISFEFFLIHQLVIKYVRALSSKLVHYDGFIIYVFSFIIAIMASYIWHYLYNKIIYKKSE